MVLIPYNVLCVAVGQRKICKKFIQHYHQRVSFVGKRTHFMVTLYCVFHSHRAKYGPEYPRASAAYRTTNNPYAIAIHIAMPTVGR